MSKRALFAATLLVVAAVGCTPDIDYERGARITNGDPHAGRVKLRRHSCTSCHVIPGIPDADGQSGPPLNAWGRKKTFLTELPNTPENLTRWLINPAEIKPTTRMPGMNVSAQDARDMAAYLMALNR